MPPRRERLWKAVAWAPVVTATVFVAVSLLVGDRGVTAAPGGASVSAPASDANAANVYLRDCASCHGVAGAGTEHAPPLADVGAAYVDYVVSSGRMPIAAPDDDVRRGPVAYDRATVVALAEYVDSFAPGGLPIPSVDVGSADLGVGGEQYRLNCAACHQAIGAGGALVDRAAPGLADATAVQVAEAIRVGPFEMPAFGSSALTDEQVEDVSAYVTEVLRNPEDRGGLSIWHLGPVPEGAVAIVVGLGLLILASMWIEGRAPRRVDSTEGGE